MSMSKLRLLSAVGFLAGIVLSFVGGALSQQVYGCVPPATQPPIICNPPAPVQVTIGEYVLLGGIVLILASVVTFAYSSKYLQEVNEEKKRDE
jgi:ABC-type antimicrobial peptide transport system permease subunit